MSSFLSPASLSLGCRCLQLLPNGLGGGVMLTDVLQVSAGVLAFLVVWMALGAFAAAEKLERAFGESDGSEVES